MTNKTFRLVASVRGVVKPVRHLVAQPGGPVEAPLPVRMEIVLEDPGVLLLRIASDGVRSADAWHASVDEAKRAAQQEFGIGADEWL